MEVHDGRLTMEEINSLVRSECFIGSYSATAHVEEKSSIPTASGPSSTKRQKDSHLNAISKGCIVFLSSPSTLLPHFFCKISHAFILAATTSLECFPLTARHKGTCAKVHVRTHTNTNPTLQNLHFCRVRPGKWPRTCDSSLDKTFASPRR